MIALCQAVGATAYLSGDFAVGRHFDPNAFAPSGIEVRRQGWRCPTYRQQYPQLGFLPELCILDLLFNEGDESLGVLMERPVGPPEPEAAPASAPVDPAEASHHAFGVPRSDEADDSSLCRAAAVGGGSYTECVPAKGSETL